MTDRTAKQLRNEMLLTQAHRHEDEACELMRKWCDAGLRLNEAYRVERPEESHAAFDWYIRQLRSERECLVAQADKQLEKAREARKAVEP